MNSNVRKLHYTATTNACKLCTPLGASLVLKGIENAVPILHGSQGCATYIRRYLISHFKEPVDIASSSFSEETAVFGGAANLKLGLDNLRRQYKPEIIGIATTCLSETIGEDVPMILREYKAANPNNGLPKIINVSTPSYTGTHMDGFHATVKAAVDVLAVDKSATGQQINLFPGMVSPADLRYLKELLTDFGLSYTMLPDYSVTLDGSPWAEYQAIQEGGTKVEDIAAMGQAQASIEFGQILAEEDSAGKLLQQRFGVPCYSVGLPIGITETDKLFDILEEISGRPTPAKYLQDRGRLIDAYVDGHKYVSQVRAVIYGEEDLVVGLATFLSEIGIIPVLCASGGKSSYLETKIRQLVPPDMVAEINVQTGVDFMDIQTMTAELSPDLLVGNSKGYALARQLNLPLVRVGFPIHDRLGGARLLHLGYGGAQHLFDKVANTIIEQRQEESGIGYFYM